MTARTELEAIVAEMRLTFKQTGWSTCAYWADRLSALTAHLDKAGLSDLPRTADAGGLLPCPFCGEQPKLESTFIGYRVFCANDDCVATVDTLGLIPSTASSAWNTRAASPSTASVAGWKLVPVEPTKEMFRRLTASWGDSDEAKFMKGKWVLGSFVEDYEAMLSAAPDAVSHTTGQEKGNG